LTKREVAAHLRVSERTVERWMGSRGLPFSKPFARGAVRFRLSEVDAWWARGDGGS
jgi:excisionase family DNA binding protein